MGVAVQSKKLDDGEIILKAAEASLQMYETPRPPSSFQHVRTVELFTWPRGELAAGVKYDGRTVYVAVRGTTVVGNWVFTNFQAFMAPFHVVDDKLSDAPSTKYQGGYYRTPSKGTIHQGFFRAFSWLWYGTEPMLDGTVRDRTIARVRLGRYFSLLWILPLLLILFFEAAGISGWVGALWGFLFAFIFVTAEAGIWEDYFKRVPHAQGGIPTSALPHDPERSLLDEIASYDRVVFTGHSLGGAIATIAFMVYNCWCRSQGVPENAVLVTFGAPRVGDKDFMDDFCDRFRGRFAHVQDPGDPVPDLPPNGMRELVARRTWMRGPLGFLVIFLYFGWTIVARMYRAPRAARWGEDTTHEIAPGTRRLSFKRHNMAAVYYPWAQSYAATKRRA